ncbi:MAG: hypothetical protein F6J86_29355 [Symploca sp. SIO1B1]|nr:hypothetical protein [Symploca sp. SIO1B1]
MILISSLQELNPTVLTGLIGGTATIFVGITAAIINQRYSKQRDIDESHRSKKVKIYSKFLEKISGLFHAVSENKVEQYLPDLTDFFRKYKTEIILWGSPEVIKCQLELEQVAEKGGDTLKSVDNLYKAIRKDIGLSNKGLDNYELVKMYLKPSEFDKLSSNTKSD